MKLSKDQHNVIKNLITREINDMCDNFIRDNDCIRNVFRTVNEIIEFNNYIICEYQTAIHINGSQSELHPEANSRLDMHLQEVYISELKDVIIKKQKNIQNIKTLLRGSLLIDLNNFFYTYFDITRAQNETIESICIEFAKNIDLSKQNYMIKNIDFNFKPSYSGKFLNNVNSYCKEIIYEFYLPYINIIKKYGLKSIKSRNVFVNLLRDNNIIGDKLLNILIKLDLEEIQKALDNLYTSIENDRVIKNLIYC